MSKIDEIRKCHARKETNKGIHHNEGNEAHEHRGYLLSVVDELADRLRYIEKLMNAPVHSESDVSNLDLLLHEEYAIAELLRKHGLDK